MQRSILEAFPETDLSVNIVWLPMLPGDDEIAAGDASKIFDDPRVRHFYDPGRLVGWAYAKDAFAGHAEKAWSSVPADHELRQHLKPQQPTPMWDLYLFYEPGVEWTEKAPSPTAWIKQIMFWEEAPDKTTGLSWKNDFARPPFRSNLFDELRALMKSVAAPNGDKADK